jgi:hypothetical protein
MARCKALCGHGRTERDRSVSVEGAVGPTPGGLVQLLLAGVWRLPRRRQGCRCAASLRSALSDQFPDCGRVARGYAARRGWADSEARSRIMRR